MSTARELHAATVVPLRDGAAGLECLMLRKTAGQAYGGLWVFPGGRVEEADGDGLDGARQAAVRETTEETKLLLEAAALVPFSYWVPPPQAPRRYLTWFFVTGLPDGPHEVETDGGEIGDHAWKRPADALSAHTRGEIDLVPPTWLTLRWLSDHQDVAAGLAAAEKGPVQRFATRITNATKVPVALWEPDVAYPSAEDEEPGDLDAPGARHRLYMDPAGWRYERHEQAH